MTDVLASLVPLSPVVGLVLGTLLAARLLVSTLLRAIPLLAIFLPLNQANRAERVLRILSGHPEVQHRDTATEAPAADAERHQYGT